MTTSEDARCGFVVLSLHEILLGSFLQVFEHQTVFFRGMGTSGEGARTLLHYHLRERGRW